MVPSTDGADPAKASPGRWLAKSLPAGADQLLTEQLKSVTSAGRQSLSIGLAVSLLAVLWSASGGVQGLVKGLNLVYDEQETRGFLKLRGLSLLLTLGAILTAAVAIALIAVFPAVVGDLGLGKTGELAASIARWVVLALLVVVALAVVYRYAPDRATRAGAGSAGRGGRLGAVAARAPSGFSCYVDNFGKYNQTYGPCTR